MSQDFSPSEKRIDPTEVTKSQEQRERESIQDICDEISAYLHVSTPNLIPDEMREELRQLRDAYELGSVDAELSRDLKTAAPENLCAYITYRATELCGSRERALEYLSPDILEKITKNLGQELSARLLKQRRERNKVLRREAFEEIIDRYYYQVRSPGTRLYFEEAAADLMENREKIDLYVSQRDRHVFDADLTPPPPIEGIDLFRSLIAHWERADARGREEPFFVDRLIELERW